MRVLIDTNVLLDVLEGRSPFLGPSTAVWALAEDKQFEGVVSSISFATLFYLGCRRFGWSMAMAGIQKVHQVFEVAGVDGNVITEAINSGLPDFEDAIQAFSGLHAGATHVVTRDMKGFSNGPLPVLTPDQFVALVV